MNEQYLLLDVAKENKMDNKKKGKL